MLTLFFSYDYGIHFVCTILAFGILISSFSTRDSNQIISHIPDNILLKALSLIQPVLLTRMHLIQVLNTCIRVSLLKNNLDLILMCDLDLINDM